MRTGMLIYWNLFAQVFKSECCAGRFPCADLRRLLTTCNISLVEFTLFVLVWSPQIYCFIFTGMRAVKSVLVMAGSLKRQNPDKPEDVVLIRALRDSNLPKFLVDDAALFQVCGYHHSTQRNVWAFRLMVLIRYYTCPCFFLLGYSSRFVPRSVHSRTRLRSSARRNCLSHGGQRSATRTVSHQEDYTVLWDDGSKTRCDVGRANRWRQNHLLWGLYFNIIGYI